MNEELIKRLRSICGGDCSCLISKSADALEAADHRISELEAQLVEFQKDADRYRWAKKHLAMCVVGERGGIHSYRDSDIDAAIKESK